MKKSAFGIESYLAERTLPEPEMQFDARTAYELMQYDFIEEDYIKHYGEHVVYTNKMRSLINEDFFDYCLRITTNNYVITAIKTKVDCLPDNNNFIPATYRCAIATKKSKVIDKFGQIASKKIYNLFAPENFR